MRFEIGLERPDQLFTADPPAPTSPWYGRFTVEPALEVVRRETWRPRRGEPVVVEVVLPAAEVRPGLAEELTAAARRWFVVADEVDASLGRSAAVEGRWTLLPSFAWFLALILVSFFVLRLGRAVHETFVLAIGQGITVSAWVILWVPVERMSRHGIDRRARQRRARALAGATVEVRAAG